MSHTHTRVCKQDILSSNLNQVAESVPSQTKSYLWTSGALLGVNAPASGYQERYKTESTIRQTTATTEAMHEPEYEDE